jgi:hypothetical protein
MINSTLSTSSNAVLEAWNVTTRNTSQFTDPELIETKEVGETLELIYLERPNISTIWHPLYRDNRVFKIIYSCKEGKWNKSERIYGEVIPASEERYSFE